MSSILKIRVPFKRRKTAGGVDGRATFYLESVPNYVPQVGQTVIITHTGVPANSPLATKLTNISTNTVTVDKALSSVPAGGEVAKQYISAFHLITGGSASANSGNTIFAGGLIKFKDSNEPVFEFNQSIDILGN